MRGRSLAAEAYFILPTLPSVVNWLSRNDLDGDPMPIYACCILPDPTLLENSNNSSKLYYPDRDRLEG
jgi:hypothetical protein